MALGCIKRYTDETVQWYCSVVNDTIVCVIDEGRSASGRDFSAVRRIEGSISSFDQCARGGCGVDQVVDQVPQLKRTERERDGDDGCRGM